MQKLAGLMCGTLGSRHHLLCCSSLFTAPLFLLILPVTAYIGHHSPSVHLYHVNAHLMVIFTGLSFFCTANNISWRAGLGIKLS